MFDDEEEEKEKVQTGTAVNYHEHSKKTKSRVNHVKRQEERQKKLQRDQNKEGGQPIFPAIQMLNDPQTIAEALFKRVRSSGEKFEIKLIMLNFISRLIGCHKLILFRFYSFLQQRYITSHQKEVTHILGKGQILSLPFPLPTPLILSLLPPSSLLPPCSTPNFS